MNNNKVESFTIAYVLEKFPSPTEYFILNEMIGLEKKGVSLILFVIKGQKRFNDIIELQNLKAQIFYLPRTIYYLPFLTFIYYPLSLLKFGFFHAPCNKQTHKYLFFRAILILFPFFKDVRYNSFGCYFWKKTNKNNITHLHSHFAFIATDVAFILSRYFKLHYSFSAHARDVFVDSANISVKIKNASFVVTYTDYNKNYLNEITNNEHVGKIYHIYHGVDAKKWLCSKTTQVKPDGTIEILSVARLVEKKGLIYLLKAVNSLVKQGYIVNCTIIGEGPLLKSLKEYIDVNELNGFVKIVNFKSQMELKQHYCQSDIFILPCIITQKGDRDGVPNVILEALSACTPVITTNVSAIPEVITDMKTGLIVPEKSDGAILRAIIKLKGNSALVDEITENGLQIVKDKFDCNKSADDIYRLFKDLCLRFN